MEAKLKKCIATRSVIAEWLEQAPCNSRVRGSNPAQATFQYMLVCLFSFIIFMIILFSSKIHSIEYTYPVVSFSIYLARFQLPSEDLTQATTAGYVKLLF